MEDILHMADAVGEAKLDVLRAQQLYDATYGQLYNYLKKLLEKRAKVE